MRDREKGFSFHLFVKEYLLLVIFIDLIMERRIRKKKAKWHRSGMTQILFLCRREKT